MQKKIIKLLLSKYSKLSLDPDDALSFNNLGNYYS